MRDSLKGRITPSGRRPVAVTGKRRSCAHDRCETGLSMYNRGKYCYAHSPVRFPRVRGSILPEGA
jgi:hypothetical protein